MATAIFTRRLNPGLHVVLVEGARKPGAKILVSGGSRCNVTNTVVSEEDFWGGRRSIVRRVLRALPVDETVAFFRDIGVSLNEEPDGKLFPDSNRARDVLAALVREVSACGVTLLADHRVHAIERRSAASVSRRRTGPLTRHASSWRPAAAPCRRAAATARATPLPNSLVIPLSSPHQGSSR